MLSDVILKKSLCLLTASWGFLLAWVCTSPSSAAPLKEVDDVQQMTPVSTGRQQGAVAEEGELLFISQNLCYFFLMITNSLLNLFKDTIMLIFEAFLLALLTASLSVSSFYYISFFCHGVFPQMCSDFVLSLCAFEDLCLFMDTSLLIRTVGEQVTLSNSIRQTILVVYREVH